MTLISSWVWTSINPGYRYIGAVFRTAAAVDDRNMLEQVVVLHDFLFTTLTGT